MGLKQHDILMAYTRDDNALYSYNFSKCNKTVIKYNNDKYIVVLRSY